MSLNKFVLLLVSSLLLVSNSYASGKSREFSLDANYISVQGSTSASLLNVAIGQLITPQIVIVTSLTTQQGFALNATTISLGGKYYFMDGFRGDLVPFAGFAIGLRQSATATQANHASTQYDVNVGLSYFIADNTTIDGKFRVLNFNDSSPTISIFSAGFSQRF